MQPLDPDPVTPEEKKLVEKLIPLIKQLIEKSYLTGTTYRDTHPKGHGAVRATFTVEPNLPEERRVGLFARPGKYPAWIRLSNLNATPQPDIKKDVRALAIKLMDVEGEMLWQSEPDATTLDLILMGSQTFLVPNLQVFYDMEVALLKGGLHAIWFFLTHPRVLRTILAGQKKTGSLLEIPYYSQTAYALGPKVVQYYLRPHQHACSKPPRRSKARPNYLRERLKAYLEHQPARFDFMVQFQSDEYDMPVENPMVPWDPDLSPYVKVATLTIEQQTFDSPEQMKFCEALSFNPWRTLPEHQPLGAVNRARLHVYPAIAKFRRERNDSWAREPRSSDPPFSTEPWPQAPTEGPAESAPKAAWRAHPLLTFLLGAALVAAAALVWFFFFRPLPGTTRVYDMANLNKNWTDDDRQWFYHTTQGSQLMPYAWFIALEQAKNSKKFIDPDFLSRFRVLPDVNPLRNSDRLPLGFCKDYPDPITKVENVGITCAACHTAQINYRGFGLRVDGAPGKMDFDGFLGEVGLSLLVTLADPLKLDRFASQVLGPDDTTVGRAELRKQLKAFLDKQQENQKYLKQEERRSGHKKTDGGFGRIDALGSGGNGVFSQLKAENVRALNAPVKAIPLWYAFFYGWVQSNSSIRQPISRNCIEALAVQASVELKNPQKRYVSSVRIEEMYKLEDLSARLQAPEWPEWLFGKLDKEKVARGQVLYINLCAGCHAPKLEGPNSYAGIKVVADKELLPYPPDKVTQKAGMKLYDLRVFPISRIGTDPNDAVNFATRKADATMINMGPQEPGPNVINTVLGGMVKRYYDDYNDGQGLKEEVREKWNGYRSALWQAPEGYPARPLPGIWAAAPYLHNGSVPNLWELLLPVAKRSKTFYTGSLEFDPVRVGYETSWLRGGFKVDTRKPGNSNSGHEFSDGSGKGVIGRLLTDAERYDLIEFLKSLRLEDEVGGERNLPALWFHSDEVFSGEDFIDPYTLALKLAQHSDRISEFLWERCSSESQQLFQKEESTPQQKTDALVREFNKILVAGPIYSEKRFPSEKLTDKTRTALNEGVTQCMPLARLNRLFLEEAYPKELKKAEPPPPPAWRAKEEKY